MNSTECIESVDKMLVLIACKDAGGLFRFPGSYLGLAGVLITKNASVSFQNQLDYALTCAIGEHKLGSKITIEHAIWPLLEISCDQKILLLLGRISEGDFIAPISWPTLPDILKRMEKNRLRIPYLKALQLLCSSPDQEVDAYELDGSKSSELLEKIWNNE